MTDPRDALLALLRQEDHAPLSTHDPRDGSCQSCPWPLHEMPPEDIADAILLAGWTPPTVKPSLEQVVDALAAQPPGNGEWTSSRIMQTARAVLALLPGRTEAEVKAETWDEVADYHDRTNAPDIAEATRRDNPYREEQP